MDSQLLTINCANFFHVLLCLLQYIWVIEMTLGCVV
jgi:hypothetical protein